MTLGQLEVSATDATFRVALIAAILVITKQKPKTWLPAQVLGQLKHP
jgi:hypothetical protein